MLKRIERFIIIGDIFLVSSNPSKPVFALMSKQPQTKIPHGHIANTCVMLLWGVSLSLKFCVGVRVRLCVYDKETHGPYQGGGGVYFV